MKGEKGEEDRKGHSLPRPVLATTAQIMRDSRNNSEEGGRGGGRVPFAFVFLSLSLSLSLSFSPSLPWEEGGGMSRIVGHACGIR